MLKLDVKKRTTLYLNSNDFALLDNASFTEVFDGERKDYNLSWVQSDGTDYSGSINNIMKVNSHYEFQLKVIDNNVDNTASSVNARFNLKNDVGTVYATALLNQANLSPGNIIRFKNIHSNYIDSKTLHWELTSDTGSINFTLVSLTIIERETTELPILDADNGIQITRSIKEITSPDKYKRGFTNSFDIILDDDTNDYLNFINLKSNSTILFDAIISDESFTLIEGSLKFSEIKRDINGKDLIRATFYENGFEFFENLKKSTLKELVKYNDFRVGAPDGSGFQDDRYVVVNESNFNRSQHTPTWFHDNSKWLYYGIVNNGNIPETVDEQRGMGEAVSTESKVKAHSSTFSVNDVYPSILVSKLFKELHAKNGYTYEGDDFFETDNWKGLLYNYWKDWVYPKSTLDAHKTSGKFAGWGNKMVIAASTSTSITFYKSADVYNFRDYAGYIKLYANDGTDHNIKITGWNQPANPLWYTAEVDSIPSGYTFTGVYIGNESESTYYLTKTSDTSTNYINSQVFLEDTKGYISNYKYMGQPNVNNMVIPGSGLNLPYYNMNMNTKLKGKLKITLKANDGYKYSETGSGTNTTNLHVRGNIILKVGYDSWGDESDNQYIYKRVIPYNLRNYSPYDDTIEVEISEDIDYNYLKINEQLKIKLIISSDYFADSGLESWDKVLKVKFTGDIKHEPHKKIAPNVRIGAVGNGGNENINKIVDDKPLMDFYKNVLQLFNMRFEIDEKRKHIKYYTFDEYYMKHSEVKDFTNKFDITKMKSDLGNKFQVNKYIFDYMKSDNYFDSLTENKYGSSEKHIVGELKKEESKLTQGYSLIPFTYLNNNIPVTENYKKELNDFISSAPSREIGDVAFFSYMNAINTDYTFRTENYYRVNKNTLPTSSSILKHNQHPDPIIISNYGFNGNNNGFILTDGGGTSSTITNTGNLMKLTIYTGGVSNYPRLDKTIALTSGVTYRVHIKYASYYGNPKIKSLFEGSNVVDLSMIGSGTLISEYTPSSALTSFEIQMDTSDGAFTQVGFDNIMIEEVQPDLTASTYTLQFRSDDLDSIYNPIDFNHYDLFYQNEYRDIIRKDAEIIEIEVQLSNKEFIDLKLNNIIKIDTNVYRIDKISNFNENKLTKIKLINITFNPFYYGSVLNPTPWISLSDYDDSFGYKNVTSAYNSPVRTFELTYGNLNDDLTIELTGGSNKYQISWDGGSSWHVPSSTPLVIRTLAAQVPGEIITISYKLVNAVGSPGFGRFYAAYWKFTSDFLDTGLNEVFYLHTRVKTTSINIGYDTSLTHDFGNVSSTGSSGGTTSKVDNISKETKASLL